MARWSNSVTSASNRCHKLPGQEINSVNGQSVLVGFVQRLAWPFGGDKFSIQGNSGGQMQRVHRAQPVLAGQVKRGLDQRLFIQPVPDAAEEALVEIQFPISPAKGGDRQNFDLKKTRVDELSSLVAQDRNSTHLSRGVLSSYCGDQD